MPNRFQIKDPAQKQALVSVGLIIAPCVEVLDTIVRKLCGIGHKVILGRATTIVSFCYLDFIKKFPGSDENYLMEIIYALIEEIDKKMPNKMFKIFDSPLTNRKLFDKLMKLKDKHR